MGSLRTSEEDSVVAGEGREAEARDDERSVDEGPKIMISAGPEAAAVQTSAPPVRRSTALPATKAEKRGGMGFVIVVYILSAAALAYAIYERFGH